jgi:hypothetical protein
MFPTTLKKFAHPAGVYELEYPSHWDQVQHDEARSCGFGPHERDDVGLWISIMPVHLDTDRLAAELPKLMEMALQKSDARDTRPDPTLHHHALKADITKEGEAGHYWVVAGGDVVLFISSQVPAAERDVWNPMFDRLMASLHITRDEELFQIKLANDVLGRLRDRYPEQDFQFDEKGIRGNTRAVFLSNLYRDVKASPSRRENIIRNFVENLSLSGDTTVGHEQWDEVQGHILPVLKPRNTSTTIAPRSTYSPPTGSATC